MSTTIDNLRRPRPRRAAGLSLVELLVALAITAMLLTATMVALDASFKAYADIAEQSSAQASTRLVTQRLLQLIRTSTAQGPLDNDTTVTPNAVLSGTTITSPYVELIDSKGNLVRVEHRAASKELWLVTTPLGTTTAQAQPLMSGVTAATFTNRRRQDDSGLWVLERSTMDVTVMPGADATMSIENRTPQPIRIIASTVPRKLN
ncbi:MAG: prepilin-type N-terminal cleavage/methylation domain-containing protein [Planctomycetota bacterium]|nr:prepilin-type N-terminal cleavage/methylation domain-containing protein [Planctomycetota bacterium]